MIELNDIKEKKKILMKEIFQKMNIHTVCAYTNKKQEIKIFFCQLSKKRIIFGFLGTLSETSSRTFFFKNSDFA